MNRSSKRRIKLLEESTKEKAKEFLKKADDWLYQFGWSDYTCEITEGKRDLYTQAGLYSLGREYVHWQGWKEIDLSKIVTWTMNSNHLTGHAFDVALYKDKIYHWPNPKIKKNLDMWLALANIGKDLGLYPGGLWENQKPDYPHFSTLPG